MIVELEINGARVIVSGENLNISVSEDVTHTSEHPIAVHSPKATGVDAIKASGFTQVALAEALGITRGAIAQWVKVPASRLLDIERITGIHRSILRPDLFDGWKVSNVDDDPVEPAKSDIPWLIETLGGNAALAVRLGVGASTVSEMKRRCRIPVKYWRRIIDIAHDQNLKISNEALLDMHITSEPAE